MIDFSHLHRCVEISRDDIILATESRATCRRFLERAAVIARPKNGGPLLLLLFSRMATLACDWLDGDLRIELSAQGELSILDVQVSLGRGSAERVFPRFTLNVPFGEFLGAVERVPQLVWPLSVTRGSKRMLLSASSDVRTSTVPPSIEIDLECQSQTIPKAPPLPLPVELPTVTITQAPRRPLDGAAKVSSVRQTIPYGCSVRTGTD